MNDGELLDIENDLKDRYEENKNLCALLDERARMSKVNQLDYKISSAFGMSLIPYVLLLIAYMITIKKGGIALITNVIPLTYLSPGIVGISFAIGSITESIIDKKFKIKKRFKNFSNAKTESEKLEQQLYYELKLEQMKSKSLVLEEVMNKRLNITDLSKYKNISTSSLPKELENILQTKEMLHTVLEEQYSRLDILIIQKYLTENMCKFRITGQDVLETIPKSLMVGMIPFMLLFMPILPVTMMEIPINSSLSFIQLGVLGISTITSTIYNLGKNRTQKKYFNKLNNALGEKKLSKNVENVNEEINRIDRLIKRKISDICDFELKMEECKKSLETIGSKEDVEMIESRYRAITAQKEIEEQKGFKSFPITEETKEHIKKHPEMYTACPPKVRMGNIYTDEEFKERSDRVLNRELPGEEKQKVKTLKK